MYNDTREICLQYRESRLNVIDTDGPVYHNLIFMSNGGIEITN